MATRRFELEQGSSRKFWEISVTGSSHTVRYGRIGTDGQSRTKSHASAAAARAAAAKLVASKVGKGYVERPGKRGAPPKTRATAKAKTNKAKASKAKASKAKASKGARPDLSIAYPYRDGFIATWRRGKDLWITGLARAPKQLDDNQRFADLLDDDGFVERWRFAGDEACKDALATLVAEKREARTAPDYVELDVKALSRHLGKRALPRIARFAVARKGPLALRRHAMPGWILPRPPSHCRCGRALVPTYELDGPLDKRLGKRALMVVSFCPGSLASRYCEGSIEVVFQTPEKKTPRAEAYFLGRDKSFHVIALGLQWNPIGSSATWLITEHRGDRGVPGVHTTTFFKSKKEADAAFKKATAEAKRHLPQARPTAFSKWYRDLLGELHAVYRAAKAEPLELRLAPSIAPTEVAASSYPWSRALFAQSDNVGGQPAYTQSDWDRALACPTCKRDMLFVFQAASGAPWWSDIINDGDAGSFQFFACPKCRGPFGGALFECH